MVILLSFDEGDGLDNFLLVDFLDVEEDIDLSFIL
jgi:hypothetical protein